MANFTQDVRFGLRVLVKSPGFTAVAVLSLGLGIGANTTIFTLVKAIFLHGVPIEDPGSVVALYSTAQSRKGPEQQYLPTPYMNAVDYRQQASSVFSGVAIVIQNGMNLTIGGGKPQQHFVELVNANFFDLLGVHPFLGRGFSPEEENSPRPVAVLSYALWNAHFGADRGVLGKTIRLDDQEYAVIGVMPRKFDAVGNLNSPDLWIPISMRDQALTGMVKGFLYDRGFRLVTMVARLKPGVTARQAQVAVHDIGLQLEKAYPKQNGGRNEMVVPIAETTIPPQYHSVFVLAGGMMMLIVGLVLLIACANVANLLLARATQRQREVAVRLALGASRSRLIRQLLTESFLLALLAGALGVLAAFWAKSVLVSFLPADVVAHLDFSIDGRVLLYTLAMAVLATLLFGLVPALQASRTDRMAALKDRTGAPTGSSRWYGLRGALVMVQVALSLVALVGAGLFIHSLRNAQKIDPGFEVKHELVTSIDLAPEHYQQPQAENFYRDVVQRLDTLPMVAASSLSDTAPFQGSFQRTTFTDGVDPTDPRNGKLTPVEAVAPEFFGAANIPLLRGRTFTDQDNATTQDVAIVNQAAADTFWPGEDPIGKRLHFLGETWVVNVVGEVKTTKYISLGEPPQAAIYFPLKQHYSPFVTLYVRTKGDPAQAIASVRNTVHSMIPSVPLLRVETMGQLLVESLTAPRMGAELLGAFGLIALVLAAIGTYGVMSYSVNQRSQEIGIRITLGAQPRDIVRLILGSGMAMVAIGIAFGLGFSVLLARGMNQLLYGIGSFDAPSFLITAAILMLVALAACYVPARRAMRVDPIVALRYE
ncbi:MAG TPA: ABC transporter permease [Candidatus Acidoferrales bacterium]|nr:ABC transporter permease [Candidatus Acidoferrales bacterium]